MAEYIEREAVIKKFKERCTKCDARFEDPLCLQCSGRSDLETVCDLPAADVKPVVRCKDCERSYKVLGDLYCGNGFRRINIFSDVEVFPDFYCAEGKRKETENEE